MGVLKVGALNLGSKHFVLQGEAESWELLPDCVALCWVGVYGESVSLAFLFISIWLFSHSPNV